MKRLGGSSRGDRGYVGHGAKMNRAIEICKICLKNPEKIQCLLNCVLFVL
jgi:hypothetical protein